MENVSNQELMHLLNQRKRLLEKEMNLFLKKHDLFTSQWSILFCIHRFGAMSQTDIWKYLNVEAPTVTRTLAKMEKNGWIKRQSGDDKRERIIELTEETKGKFPVIKQTVDEIESELLVNLTTKEKNQLYYLLNKMG